MMGIPDSRFLSPDPLVHSWRPELKQLAQQWLWLDVDTKLRELTRDRRSLDDFARTFFGITDKSYDVATYSFDDVVATLNAISPYDWKKFLRERLDGHGPEAPLEGVARSGWKLILGIPPDSGARSCAASER